MEVWCGIIVGFDNDDAGIFAAQSRFVREARIVSAMVNMLVAIPRTPLYKRLASEGRLTPLEDEEHTGGFGTNVVPLRISREALYAGYTELMRELYDGRRIFCPARRIVSRPELPADASPHALSAPSSAALVHSAMHSSSPKRPGSSCY